MREIIGVPVFAHKDLFHNCGNGDTQTIRLELNRKARLAAGFSEEEAVSWSQQIPINLNCSIGCRQTRHEVTLYTKMQAGRQIIQNVLFKACSRCIEFGKCPAPPPPDAIINMDPTPTTCYNQQMLLLGSNVTE